MWSQSVSNLLVYFVALRIFGRIVWHRSIAECEDVHSLFISFWSWINKNSYFESIPLLVSWNRWLVHSSNGVFIFYLIALLTLQLSPIITTRIDIEVLNNPSTSSRNITCSTAFCAVSSLGGEKPKYTDAYEIWLLAENVAKTAT